MIGQVKIYDSKGNLKKIIKEEKAKSLYNDNNKEEWCLSDAEKKWWKGLKTDEVVKEKSGNGNQRSLGKFWLKRDYKKRGAIFECTCVICGNKKMLTSPNGKYCSEPCRGVGRRKQNKEQYEKSKLGFSLPKKK